MKKREINKEGKHEMKKPGNKSGKKARNEKTGK
jgi:hypothetical protein